MEWLLHVKDRAHGWPLARMTPHWRSTSTGPNMVGVSADPNETRPGGGELVPLGLGTFALGSSFFFLVLGALSRSPSAFRFLPFLSSSGFLPAAFLPPTLPFGLSSSSLSSSALASPFSSSALRASSSLAASLALSLASLASFLRWAFSFFSLRHCAIWAFAAVLRTLFLQCLHCCRSGLSSRGRPVAKVSRAVSSSWLTTGPGDAMEADGEVTAFFLSSAGVSVGGRAAAAAAWTTHLRQRYRPSSYPACCAWEAAS